MSSVLITRPRATAEPLAAALEKLGYQSVIEPLLAIEPYVVPRPQTDLPQAVIITSGSALFALANRHAQVADLLNLPCFCVGPRTAEKASDFGFRHVQNAEGDGTELARVTTLQLGRKKTTVMHLAGRDIDRKTHQELEREGHRVIVWPVYEALPIAAFTAELRNRFERGQLDAVMLFSPRTAEVLAKLLADAELEACCSRLAAICLSPVVAHALEQLPWRHLRAVSTPTEKAVIACLLETCPVQS